MKLVRLSLIAFALTALVPAVGCRRHSCNDSSYKACPAPVYYAPAPACQ